MKIRKKKKPRYEQGHYPERGTPEWDALTPRERKLACLAPKFKPGESGNPLGRKVGSGSIVTHLKKALREPSRYNKYENTAHELSGVIMQKARKGHIGFVQMLVDRTENKMMTREQIENIIDTVYGMFLKYVRDEKTRAKISRAMIDLKLDEEE
jgi:hypothetical protein